MNISDLSGAELADLRVGTLVNWIMKDIGPGGQIGFGLAPGMYVRISVATPESQAKKDKENSTGK